MIIAITQDGYIKKTPKSEFMTKQIGSAGEFRSYYSDGIRTIKEASLEDTLFLFTEKGKCCRIDVPDIPSTKISEKGLSLKNRYEVGDDAFCTILSIKSNIPSEDIDDYYLIIMTRKGRIIKQKLTDYKNKNIIQSISLNENDSMADATLIKRRQFILNSCNMGRGRMFDSDDIPTTSLSSKGKGVLCFGRMINDENVILHSLDSSQTAYETEEILYRYISKRLRLHPDESFLLVSKQGYVRRTEASYGSCARGANGSRLINLKQDDTVVFNTFITNLDNILVLTAKGNVIRIDLSSIDKIKFCKRGIRLNDNDYVVACCKISPLKEISINSNKYIAYKQETEKSQNLLLNIFNEVEDNIVENNNRSEMVIEILKILFEKGIWNKEELERICNSKGLILGAILEEINDYSYSKVDDAVIEEDGDCIYVTLDYKNELL